MSLYVGGRLLCRFGWKTPAYQTVTRCRIDTIDSPDDEHMGARNMQKKKNKHIGKRNVHQVGYLQELYRAVARSAKHKIQLYSFFNP